MATEDKRTIISQFVDHVESWYGGMNGLKPTGIAEEDQLIQIAIDAKQDAEDQILQRMIDYGYQWLAIRGKLSPDSYGDDDDLRALVTLILDAEKQFK